MKEVTYRLRVEQAERYGIRYMRYVSRGQWPNAHHKLLEDIEMLGKTLFSNYNADVTIDSLEKPWRAENKKRSKTLAQETKNLSNHRRNEPGWRLNLEPLVFYRFKVEVTW